jgi:uncharacterized membrane protein YkoI
MNLRKLSLLALSLLLSVIATANGASRSAYNADLWNKATISPPTMLQGGGVSLDQAVAMLRVKYNARVMRANTVEEGGRAVHYIRLMSADRSRVWTVRVDAATGQEI